MEITLTDIEREAYKNSPIHRLDGRAKILAVIAIIVFAVSLPRMDETNFSKLIILELYIITLMAIARLNPVYTIMRFLSILPFGLAIVLIQPFVRQPFIDSFTVYPLDLPLGITVTYEGISFGLILLAKYIVCITAIVLMSSTMKMNDMVTSARRLGMPAEFTLILSMMVRYLFVFWIILKRIRVAQKTRLFYLWNKDVPHKWILEQVAYTISSLFIRSYEQGERTYISMLCRGYSSADKIYVHKNKLKTSDILFSMITIGIMVVAFLA
ncbi:cobalt ECF transporter T component CbiQ [Methanolobus sp. WCC1]|jgi:cobalt/nickel transport system permease protein|uniref:Cobalt ABC transporter, permease protein CbiQ n=1 Tax=Methanolobus tindarius DSM 2278 TaxID=1090322 RepID=W9DRF4_METTI|nr:cobalt ECF transporter T component CbiQ [Methanolobus tindarius]ETA68303.1 cobalt ABC transporter, permease protein CbiQ [Methanolobus tindarius DSM 2278]MDI3486377.1 cobalt/nickel transport system permease protein [Methanolobus sp.]